MTSNITRQLQTKGVFDLANIKPEDIKETIEVPSADSGKYESLGWVVIDSYKMDNKDFTVLAWAKPEAPVKP